MLLNISAILIFSDNQPSLPPMLNDALSHGDMVSKIATMHGFVSMVMIMRTLNTVDQWTGSRTVWICNAGNLSGVMRGRHWMIVINQLLAVGVIK